MIFGRIRGGVGHPIRDVYLCYFSQILLSFFVMTALADSLAVGDFADYSFALVSTGCAAIIVNSVFDGILNRDISEGVFESYFGVLIIKILMYLFFSVAYILFVDVSGCIVFFALALSFLSVLVEHLDLYIRSKQIYSVFRLRFFVSVAFFPWKLFYASQGSLAIVLSFSVAEMLIFSFVDFVIAKFSVRQWGVKFSAINASEVLKAMLGGGAIFIFLRIDQFFVYLFIGREPFAVYSLAVRFNELANGLSGIISRHYIPRLYSGEISFRSVLLAIWGGNMIFSVFVFSCSVFYFLFIVPDFYEAIEVLPYLLISGFFLSFGQVRGVLFIKKRDFYPDILNAMLGIFLFLILAFSLEQKSISYVALLWGGGCFFSGVLMTIAYKSGREFLGCIFR